MPVKVQLFITCLGEQFFPNALKGMVEILERMGVEVAFPQAQTCCGQPFFNTGFLTQARDTAARWLDTFTPSQGLIVSPSGSCVDMVRRHYNHLFPEGSPRYAQAQDASERTFEFTQFLVNVLQVVDVGARFPHRVTYHASCHTLRGVGVRHEPKLLLSHVRDLTLVPLQDEEVCCGFGGAFSVIYPEVSRSMMVAKLDAVAASGAEYVTALDPGCLMNIGGGLVKRGAQAKAIHLIEILNTRA